MMKIGVRSYGTYRDHLNGFGGLELRYTVHWAHFLRTEGHEVHFFDERRGCDSSFDVALDVPRHDCSNIQAKVHVHNWFSPFDNIEASITEAFTNPCYQEKRFILSLPYRYGYSSAVRPEIRDRFGKVIFLPLPYPDDLVPPGLRPGFQRDVIFWGNKGNFNSEFGPERGMHYITNGINTLAALVKLSKRCDFKVVFVLDNLIRTTRSEWQSEVESLIAQLPRVERIDQVTWSQYLKIMSHTKINTHVGDLTSGINECLMVGAVPAASRGFIFFQDVARELDMMPPAEQATVSDIYTLYERLWFDSEYYDKVRSVFQEAFQDHRTPALRRHWAQFLAETREFTHGL